MNFFLGSIEILIYCSYISLFIYILIHSYISKKEISKSFDVYKYQMILLEIFLTRFFLIVGPLPIILSFTIGNDNSEFVGIFIYFFLFLVAMSISLLSLLRINGDFYFKQDGIYFIRKRTTMLYSDINRTEWYSSYPRHYSNTYIYTSNKKVRIINLSEEHYIRWIHNHIQNSTMYTCELKTYSKIYEWFTILFNLPVLVIFFWGDHYSSKYGGGVPMEPSYLPVDLVKGYYLNNHGNYTLVGYSVWSKVKLLQVLSIDLIFLTTFITLIHKFLNIKKVKHPFIPKEMTDC